jgi:hypothetical protein
MVEAAREVRCPADFRVEPQKAGGAKVELKGELPAGWCGQLAAALSRRGVSIVRGSASAEGTGWYGLFEVAAGPEVLLPELDYWALVNEPVAEHDGILRLESFVLTTSRNMPTVELSVRGPDRTGFLAALLEHLATLGLEPERISVETVDGSAADTLWLRASDGKIPKESSLGPLRDLLRTASQRGVRSSPRASS